LQNSSIFVFFGEKKVTSERRMDAEIPNDTSRFQMELEFVQLLGSAEYLHCMCKIRMHPIFFETN